MGKKTAERMVVELKNKVKIPNEDGDREVNGDVLSDVIDGLVSLGYTQAEARNAVEGIDTKGKDTQDVLKEVLGRI
jgi:Holliday junction DNA helicase RuvA